MSKRNVVGDMRQADVKAGGQGAPLLPLCHRAFASVIDKPIAVLNMGGVANLTWLGERRRDILAFDTGPANALMDDLIKYKTGKDYDFDGSFAAKGKVDEALIQKWLTHPYFEKQIYHPINFKITGVFTRYPAGALYGRWWA